MKPPIERPTTCAALDPRGVEDGDDVVGHGGEVVVVRSIRRSRVSRIEHHDPEAGGCEGVAELGGPDVARVAPTGHEHDHVGIRRTRRIPPETDSVALHSRHDRSVPSVGKSGRAALPGADRPRRGVERREVEQAARRIADVGTAVRRIRDRGTLVGQEELGPTGADRAVG